MVRRITEVGEEVLHRPCRDVTEFGPDLAALIGDMFLTMRVADGAGLAANQVGVDLRLFVYDCPDDDGVRHVGHIANPVLDQLDPAGRRLLEEGEGCLSVPGAVVDVPRPDRAVVRGFDQTGTPSPSRERGTSPAACSTRPTTSTVTSTWTGSPSGNGGTRCGRWRTGASGSSPAAPSGQRNSAADQAFESRLISRAGWFRDQVDQAFGATFDSPLMMRSIASPPVGSVRLASIFRVNFISSGWVRPRSAAIFMTLGLPMSFTKARPRV